MDMVPIMNMFLVLIPFLLMSASFFHIKAINTSVPVLAETDQGAHRNNSVKVTGIVEIKSDRIVLSTLSDSAAEQELSKWDRQITRNQNDSYPFDLMTEHLRQIKEKYPASDTLILIPHEDILYETIIQAMDVARHSKDQPLFQNVVLSGKVE
jgi:biopolymer transport protein ExbD